ncbi:hypothetical protein C1645_835742 [Glomus cerebriforme]|uniref:Uncharacterized protein n=1 Tax=Glomus cerebriforme TaxID=658196 RepID=A0A397SD57_9GLOM|nr:hypothetical protein C1645_835742 [Glomus cerebriforme]
MHLIKESLVEMDRAFFQFRLENLVSFEVVTLKTFFLEHLLLDLTFSSGNSGLETFSSENSEFEIFSSGNSESEMKHKFHLALETETETFTLEIFTLKMETETFSSENGN